MLKFTKVGHIQGTGTPNYLKGAYGVCLYDISAVKHAIVTGFEDAAVSVYNVSDPTNIALTGMLQGAGTPTYFGGASKVKGFMDGGSEFAAVTCHTDDALVILNISNPAAPTEPGKLVGAGSPNYLEGALGLDIATIGGTQYAFVTGRHDDSLVAIDIDDPANPALSDAIFGSGAPNYLGGAHDVSILYTDGHWYAFVVSADDNAFSIFNIDNPAAIVLETSVQGNPYHLDEPHSIHVVGNYAYITSYGSSELAIIMVADPGTPTYVGHIGAEGTPYYMKHVCDNEVLTIGADIYVLMCGLLEDSLVAVEANLPPHPSLMGVKYGFGFPNYLGGSHGVTADTTHVYVASYIDNALVAFSYEVIDDPEVAISGSITADCSISVGEASDIACAVGGSFTVSAVMDIDMGSFLAEIKKPHFYPIRRAYMLDSEGIEFDISDKVKDYDRILWQIEQQYELNQFTANDCSITLNNDDHQFDVDNAANYFVTTLGRNQDGYKTPVFIKCGFILPDGTESLIPVFYGLIVDTAETTDDTAIQVDLQCVSRILRDSDCSDIGDQVTGLQLFGGDTVTEVMKPIGTTSVELWAGGEDFPDGFPDSGYIKIEDEIIFYGELVAWGFKYCLRGRKGTSPAVHYVGVEIQLCLDDGSETGGNKFSFPLYPITVEGITEISSSDGDITLVKGNEVILGFTAAQRKVTGVVDWEKGILELGETPTDSTSLTATYKIVPRGIPYHTLIKRLLVEEELSTDLIDAVEMSDRLQRKIPVSYGRVNHAKDGDEYTALIDAPLFSMVADSSYLYLGIGGYLVRWDDEEFTIINDFGSGKMIPRLGLDANGNVYGVVRTNDLTSYGEIFKYDGSGVLFLLGSEDACYLNMSWGREGGQWRGFSVDDTNSVIWFIYKSGANRGLAKVGFDGTGYTKYTRPAKGDLYMDFIDTGDEIQFFYSEVGAGQEKIQYDYLTKATGLWTQLGIIRTMDEDANHGMMPIDLVYNEVDSKIYLNILYVTDNDNIYEDNAWRGWFISVPYHSITETYLATYLDNWSIQSRYAGGIYYNGYAWYVRGTGRAIGDSWLDDDWVDSSTGHLYRIVNNVIEDIGPLAYRPITEGETAVSGFPEMPFFVRENVKGVSAIMAFRASEDVMFMSASDAVVRDNQFYGYSLIRYCDVFTPVVRVGNYASRSKWDVMSELARISNYELGVSRWGKVFFRKRASGCIALGADISDVATTILAYGTTIDEFDPDGGYIQIGTELIEYTGITGLNFTGCTRGIYNTTATNHTALTDFIWQIDNVIMNRSNEATLKYASKMPNWDEIYNYIIVSIAGREAICDYATADEAWVGSSEQIYGRRIMRIDTTFLTDDDNFIADAIAWRIYDFWKDRHGLVEFETSWQPQMDLGHQLSIKQTDRTPLDYVVARVRRIEMEMANFFIRALAVIRPSAYRRNIYDYN